MSTKSYKSDWKIKKTIREVVYSFVTKGNVIIVGMGGVAIAHGRAGSIHFKLQAPLDWRVKVISKIHKLSSTDARRNIMEIDKSRRKLIDDFKCDEKECVFDVIINSERMSTNEIVAMILNIMENKHLI